MQEVKAYVKENMLDQVIDGLSRIPGAPGVTVLGVRAYGHSGESGTLSKTSMVKLEMDVNDELVSAVVEAIVENGKTGPGHIGDGKVIVTPINRVVSIAGQ